MIWRSPEQRDYASLITSALQPGPPLLAGAAAGLGKTHGYTLPLVQSGRRVAVALSTRQLIDQYLDSDAVRQALALRPCTVAALRPRRDFDSDLDHQRHRAEALAADLLVVTHAATIIDSLHPGYADLRRRDVLLFDEADLLADAADLRSTFRIDALTLRACRAEGLAPQPAAQRVREAALDAEDRASASAILYALERPAWYRVVGFEDDGALALRHRMPGRMLRRLVEQVPCASSPAARCRSTAVSTTTRGPWACATWPQKAATSIRCGTACCRWNWPRTNSTPPRWRNGS